MSKNIEAILIIATSGLIFGCFTLFSLFSIQGFVMGSLFGAYTGFAVLPFFDSNKWRPQPIWCGVFGGLLAIAFVAIVLHPVESIQTIILAGIVGVVVGLFAPLWAKYV